MNTLIVVKEKSVNSYDKVWLSILLSSLICLMQNKTFFMFFFPSIDKTFKLFYGGAQKRPESNATRSVIGANGMTVGHVPDGGRKDVRNAVEAALKGASG